MPRVSPTLNLVHEINSFLQFILSCALVSTPTHSTVVRRMALHQGHASYRSGTLIVALCAAGMTPRPTLWTGMGIIF